MTLAAKGLFFFINMKKYALVDAGEKPFSCPHGRQKFIQLRKQRQQRREVLPTPSLSSEIHTHRQPEQAFRSKHREVQKTLQNAFHVKRTMPLKFKVVDKS